MLSVSTFLDLAEYKVGWLYFSIISLVFALLSAVKQFKNFDISDNGNDIIFIQHF